MDEQRRCAQQRLGMGFVEVVGVVAVVASESRLRIGESELRWYVQVR